MTALGPVGLAIVKIEPGTWTTKLEQGIMNIEQVFPVSLQDSISYLKWIANLPDSVFLVAKMNDLIVGYTAGAKLEYFGDISGVTRDPHFGVEDTFYLESVAVLKSEQSKGVGKQLLRAILLRARKNNFRYISGHMRKGFAEKWRGVPLAQFADYYRTGEVYEYFRRELKFGSWTAGCRSVINVQAILAGFAALILVTLLTIPIVNAGSWAVSMVMAAILVTVASVGILIYSVEHSTDALDQHDPIIYVDSLVYYNIGVILFLAGIALTLSAYLTNLLVEGIVSTAYLSILVLVWMLIAYPMLHWARDLKWLSNKTNRLAYPFAFEFEEED